VRDEERRSKNTGDGGGDALNVEVSLFNRDSQERVWKKERM
jgi:hypothetical protein